MRNIIRARRSKRLRQRAEVGGGGKSQYEKCGTEEEGTQPLVQESAMLAHRLRSSHRRAEAAVRIHALLLSRSGRNERWVGRDGGYADPYGKCSGGAGLEFTQTVVLRPVFTQLAGGPPDPLCMLGALRNSSQGVSSYARKHPGCRAQRRDAQYAVHGVHRVS